MSETVRVVDEGDDYAVLEIAVDESIDRLRPALTSTYPIRLPGTAFAVVLDDERAAIPQIDRPRRLRLSIEKVDG